MTSLTLHIGNKRYSSWSLRAWLPLKKSGAVFAEDVIPLDTPEMPGQLASLSPARTVPVLTVDGAAIWDSLAIAEWAAERAPALWPADPVRRARARAATATMHSGFLALRKEMPMNLGRDNRPVARSAACEADVAKLVELWRAVRQDDAGYLFNDWSIADAFFTPVATRIRSYGVELPADADAYVSALLEDLDFVAWRAAALEEPWRNPLTEDI